MARRNDYSRKSLFQCSYGHLIVLRQIIKIVNLSFFLKKNRNFSKNLSNAVSPLNNYSMLFLSTSLSVSDSGSSQGLSQPSTQTTQYLRADTPNNAAPVTSKTSFFYFFSPPSQSPKLSFREIIKKM